MTREINVHKRIIHKNVINFYAAWKEYYSVFIVIEWASGVRQKMGGLAEGLRGAMEWASGVRQDWVPLGGFK